jgi:membrane protease YdiL (CAAX protease family)
MPPPPPTSAQLVLSLLILGLLSAMLGAWAWVIGRIATGRGLLPPAPARVVPWRGKHVIGMLLLYLIIQLVVPVVLLVAAGVKPVRGPKGELDSGLLNLATIAVNATFLVVGPWLLMKWTDARPADFGVERGRVGRDVLRGIVAWPLLAPIVFGASYLANQVWSQEKHPLQDWVEGDPSTQSWVLAVVSAAVLAPAVEEFVFRGLVLGWLGRWASRGDRRRSGLVFDTDFDVPAGSISRGQLVDVPSAPDDFATVSLVADVRGVTSETLPLKPPPLAGRGRRLLAANVLVSALFAAMHFHVWPTPVPLFFLALGLGALYQRTGSLLAPIVLHATFNSISTLLLYLTLQANPGALKPKPPVGPLVPPDAVGMQRDVDAPRHPRPIGGET